jgi:hypothetical protein
MMAYPLGGVLHPHVSVAQVMEVTWPHVKSEWKDWLMKRNGDVWGLPYWLVVSNMTYFP